MRTVKEEAAQWRKATRLLILAVLVWIDRATNDKWFHGRHETISSRLGRVQQQYGGAIPWTRPIQAVLSRGLNWLDPGHCRRSIGT